MAAQQKHESINLLPQKQFSYTTTGRILSWILSTFRIIVIVTEMIVMFAFLSRFWLDAKNSNLTDELEQRKTILAASTEFEEQFAATQAKLALIDALDKENKLVANIVDTTSKGLPPDTLLTSLSVSPPRVILVGLSPSEQSIQQLIVNLQANKSIGTVSLSGIKPNPTDPSLMGFDITIELPKEETN